MAAGDAVLLDRRSFLQTSGHGFGALALGSLLFDEEGKAATVVPENPKVRRVISLFMSGGPSQMDLLDPKPGLEKERGKELPESIRGEQRITTMTSVQKSLPVLPSPFKFGQHGQSGLELSELLPHWGEVADELCVIRSMNTEAINHDPAITFFQSGNQQPGRPCFGSWCSYGLGSDTADLPAFVVLLSGGGQPVPSRYWHNGFLPSRHQGVKFQSSGDPVLFLSNPKGMSDLNRKKTIDRINALNQLKYAQSGDPEIEARMDAFQLAYRMQSSVPGLMDLSQEPKDVLESYGAQPGKASFASNCLLARRLAEAGVRFIQLYDRGWDHHDGITNAIKGKIASVDRPTTALLKDLKERGMLEDTLVIWGGEFGRTTYAQTRNRNFGRDHHPACFSMWMAGGGIQPGMVHGQTDEFSYNVTDKAVHVHDLQATILHLLGIDHEALTFRFKGRDFRLTDVHGKVVTEILA